MSRNDVPIAPLACALVCLAGGAVAQEQRWLQVGTEDSAELGAKLSLLADLDHDGTTDLLVAAPGSGERDVVAGRVFAVSGATGSILYSCTLQRVGDNFGRALAVLDDHDGDGVPEFAVGAPRFTDARGDQVGLVSLRSGRNGTKILDLPGTEPWGYFGWSLTATDDVDGDGHRDLLIGAPFELRFGEGRVYSVSGTSLDVIGTVVGDSQSESFGYDLATVGDVDGDGWNDFAASDPFDGRLARWSGSVWIVSTAKRQTLLRVDGEGQEDVFGFSLAPSVDFDGDGVDDLLVGRPQLQAGKRGEVRVISAVTGATLWSVFGVPDESIGFEVATVGDLDGDGAADVAAASMTANRFYSGRTREILARLDNHPFSGPETFAAVGDVDGDGFDDFGRGIRSYGNQEAGAVELRAGDALFLWLEPSVARAGDTVGFHVRAGSPNELAALFVERVDGVPFQHLVWLGRLDSGGAGDLSRTIPPGLNALLELRAYSIESGTLVDTAAAALELR